MPSLNWGFKMNKDRLKVILSDLKKVIAELESEVYSDIDSYKTLNIDYDEVLKYYDTNDDDGDYE